MCNIVRWLMYLLSVYYCNTVDVENTFWYVYTMKCVWNSDSNILKMFVHLNACTYMYIHKSWNLRSCDWPFLCLWIYIFHYKITLSASHVPLTVGWGGVSHPETVGWNKVCVFVCWWDGIDGVVSLMIRLGQSH